MEKYLDFKKEEKGYKRFYVTREAVRANVGKKICYVDYVDPYRGSYIVRYGVIHSIRHSRLFLDNMEREINVRDILECGIQDY